MEKVSQSLFDFTSESGSSASPDSSAVRGFNIEKAIAEEWHLPLGDRVELWTANPEQCLRGRLELADIPGVIDSRQSLKLRIQGVPFDSRNIVSWALLDPPA